MTEVEVKKKLRDTLIKCGIPGCAIDDKLIVRVADSRNTHFIRPDLIVVTDSGEMPLAIFEIKGRSVDLELFYQEARREVRYALPKNIKCFAVAPASDSTIMMARIEERNCRGVEWQVLSDLDVIKGFLGDYNIESKKMVAQHGEDRSLNTFRWRVVSIGFIIVVGAVLGESFGVEYSWKIYSLIWLLFALYAVSYGFPVKLKVGDCEVSLIPSGDGCSHEGSNHETFSGRFE